ncbi:preprotein translocase subunit SecE [Alterileibacterium massiliense]|uniref:preprotein translocase subunit SecE n=1 Tax=Alterileibacterium massiliense TaxID=1870997 RepID=UPI0009F2171A|nr:preprotein translocase subunit SecE [Alterileibacterium massiliense]
MANKNRNTAKGKQKQVNRKATQNASTSGKKGFLNFFKGVKQELSKVVWPTRDELVTDTIAVFVAVGIFAVAFWLIDTGFLAALKHLLGITLS